jgi:hypothetical protein
MPIVYQRQKKNLIFTEKTRNGHASKQIESHLYGIGVSCFCDFHAIHSQIKESVDSAATAIAKIKRYT